MKKTNYVVKKSEMITQPYPNCHDGEGQLMWTDVSGKLPEGSKLQWLHDHVIDPGASIGIHAHTNDEEYYYVLSGTGLMTLNGEEFSVSSGDMVAVYPGGSHGIQNTATEPMRLLVISIHH